MDGVKLRLVDSVAEASELMTWLGERRDVLAIDTETEGLQWWHHKIRLIQVGDAMTGWAIPWDMWGGVALEALGRYGGPVAMHNAKFDVQMIERWTGLTLDKPSIECTRVLAHILEPNRPTGLKSLAARYVDPKAAAASRLLDEQMALNKWTWATVPLSFEPFWAYGALDTVLTARLWQQLKPQVQATAPRAFDLEMAVTWVIMGMERRGCQIDVEYTRQRLKEFRDYVEQAEAWCLSEYGVKPGSTQPCIERMQRDGVDFSKLTNGGALSLDKEVLEDVVERTAHPLAVVILQRRRLQKLASGYLENFLDLQHDGRVHPSFNTLKNENSKYGARTGRMSVTDPALQTLPRRSESNPAAIQVRNCITASEGRTLLMCDFSQIEMRMLAHFSRDPGLIAAFDEGDFFTNVARELYADPTLEKKDPRRQATKNGMYALDYGAGVAKIAITTGASLAATQAWYDALTTRFPGIRQFQRDVDRVARQRGLVEGDEYVISPLTGRRHVADKDKTYTLVNYLIQGTAAEVLKLKNLEMAAAGLEEYMILDVHDEVIQDVPNDVLQDVMPLTHRIVEDHTLFSLPLTATIDTAFRWGEK